MNNTMQEPNPEARQQVTSCRVQTALGTVTLDEEPDVREILLLSEEFKIDEILSLSCIQAALEEQGVVSAAAAGGILFEERKGLLSSLWLLLQAQVMRVESLNPQLYNLICAFNSDLLSDKEGSSTLLIKSIVEVIRSNPAEVTGDSRLDFVIDSCGREVSRHTLAQREVSYLCECLVYCAWILQRLSASDIGLILDAHHHLELKTKAQPGLAVSHQAFAVTLAALLSFLPIENLDGAVAREGERSLVELSGKDDLHCRISKLDPSVGSCSNAMLLLGWGVFLSLFNDNAVDEAAQLVMRSINAGVFRHISKMMGSTAMEDEPDYQKKLYASIANELLMAFLDTTAGRNGVADLFERSIKDGPSELESGTLMPHGAQLMAMEIAPSFNGMEAPDDLATLLLALGSVYKLYPDLFLVESLRYDVMENFMTYIAGHEVVLKHQSPSVFLAMLSVLRALASGNEGARSMFLQLHTDDPSAPLSWASMFGNLVAVIKRYALEDDSIGSDRKGVMDAEPLNFWDSAALCAYLELFSQVMTEGAAEEAATWLRLLESDAGIAPVWEILIQAMCCPVPLALKACLDKSIASLASSQPEIASHLMDRVIAATVVQLPSPEGVAPRYDLSYQLNEIASRIEDYTEVIAFVNLLNALWRGMEDMLPDEGRPYLHLTRFVKNDVLGIAPQRAYKEENQKWEIIANCMEHAEITLHGVQSWVATGTGRGQHGILSPGLDTLQDLIGEQVFMKTLSLTAFSDVELVAHERQVESWGAAKEAAILASLRLLSSALHFDVEFVKAARQANRSGVYETLDMVLRNDQRRLPALFDWVRYPYNPAVQAEAITVAQLLIPRIHNIVTLVLNSPPSGPVPLSQRLQDGFASCLHDSLFDVLATVMVKRGVNLLEEDPRAANILQLLSTSLEGPAPNFTHLLCGFDVESGMGPFRLNHLRSQSTILTVLLEALGATRMWMIKPRLYELILELVYRLAADFDAGPAVLKVLRQRDNLVFLGDIVAMKCLPEDLQTSASSLHQRAWLLDMWALMLHQADPHMPEQKSGIMLLITSLFFPAQASQGGLLMTNLLKLVTHSQPAAPSLAQMTSPELRRMVQELGVESLLTSPTISAVDIWVHSSRGDAIYDIDALKNELLRRFSDYVSRHGGAKDALKEAGRLALQFAQEHNVYVEILNAHSAFLKAWKSVALVTFSRRFDVVLELMNGGSPHEVLLDIIDAGLQACLDISSSSQSHELAIPICEAIQGLMARFQEQVAMVLGLDPSMALPIPERSLDLLRKLLEILWEYKRSDEIRPLVYGTLTTYFSMCKGPLILRAPPLVGELIAEFVPGASLTVAQLKSVHLKLEEGNAVLLQKVAPMLDIIAADATSPAPDRVITALTALSSLLSADAASAIAEAIYASGLPSRMLIDLEDEPVQALVSFTPLGQAQVLAAEARLNLLLQLALAGEPSTRLVSAERLLSLQAIQRLSRCGAMSLQPEEPGLGNDKNSIRRWLHNIVTPLLRFVVALVAALPSSDVVQKEVAAFVDTHSTTLARILHDAASPAIQDWEPDNAELEEAALVLQILAGVTPQWLTLKSAMQLQEAAYRASATFFAPAHKSRSPVVARIAIAHEAGMVSNQIKKFERNVVSLQCALACFFRELALRNDKVVFRAVPSAPGGSELLPTLSLIKDALLQTVSSNYTEATIEFSNLHESLKALRPGVDDGRIAALLKEILSVQTQLVKLSHLIEQFLGILFYHLQKALVQSRERHDSLKKSPAGFEALGSIRDLQTLRRALEPIVFQLERDALKDGWFSRVDGKSFQLLLRRTKECLSLL